MTDPHLDESPVAGLIHGLLARGDAELAVDRLDLGPDGARGHVEVLRELPGGKLAGKEAEHVEFSPRKLLVELSLPRPARAEPPFLTLQELRKHASVGSSLQ